MKLKRVLLSCLLSACLLAGCGGDEEEPQDLTPFLGTWTIGSGMFAATCANFPASAMVSGNVILSMSTSSALQMTFSDTTLSGCALAMDVSATGATIRPNQMCPISYMGFAGSFKIDNGTFTPTGTTAALSTAGSATVTLPGTDISIPCDMGTLTASLNKVAP
jgi:hypothetical protein